MYTNSKKMINLYSANIDIVRFNKSIKQHYQKPFKEESFKF